MNSHQLKVACVQYCADNDIAANLFVFESLVREAKAAGAELVALPENFPCIAHNDQETLRLAMPEAEHAALAQGRRLAEELQIWLLLGSITVRISDDKVHNRSLLLNPQGEIVARYNKLHLFDVQLANNEGYCESNSVSPGEHAVLASTPWGLLGMSICYDLRFPALYRCLAQAGAELLSIPAAFTATTGAAHWHTLVRARAIETGCYVIAPGQCGTRRSGRSTYGHSLIVNPWGEVIADAGTEPGYILAQLDLQQVAICRQRIPALQHDRPFSLVYTGA